MSSPRHTLEKTLSAYEAVTPTSERKEDNTAEAYYEKVQEAKDTAYYCAGCKEGGIGSYRHDPSCPVWPGAVTDFSVSEEDVARARRDMEEEEEDEIPALVEEVDPPSSARTTDEPSEEEEEEEEEDYGTAGAPLTQGQWLEVHEEGRGFRGIIRGGQPNTEEMGRVFSNRKRVYPFRDRW